MTERRPKRLAIPDLDQIALDYLARFATSAKRVEDMLTRRIRRSAHFHGDDPAPLLAAIPVVIAKLQRNRFLDDAAFAGMKAASLTRRGTSKRQIGAKLAQLGVAAETRGAAIDGLREEFGNVDEAAAIAYAKRRRLGRYRARHIAGEQRLEQAKRDLAAMARAGFSYDLAKRVLGSGIDIDTEFED
ncbi:regulatory protein RecX [Dongia rigui]|uniref:Regulatory protein RecX n=1 Tax=Dongia rigui TaxID=940149 RepID=A0ABU5E1P3_9PROT|nr:RecX family transcriptional regulator [Dongia rigui]MDY0873429.1 RecX family transcriptional regulator [Dongia rigui]